MATILVTEDLDEIIHMIKDAVSKNQAPVILIPGADESVVQKSVANLLIRFGLQPNRVGFRQIQLAVMMYMQDPALSFSKEVYPVLAERLGLSGQVSVERSIRTAITAAWECRSDPVWDVFAAYNAPPSNKLFIATLAQMVE